GFTVFLVALVLVFQRDIRRAFERLAAWRPASEESFSDSERLNRLLAETAAKIAEDRIGALIVLSGREPALDHIRGGIPLSGQASMPLLQSIFHPETPGHDGAVVIENGRIERFGAHL